MPPQKETEDKNLDQNVGGSEGDLLVKFRNKVKDLENLSDAELIRFLRGKDFDLKSAEEMLRRSVEWKRSVQFDDALNWEIPQRVADHFTFYMDGYDADGRTVMYLPVGSWEIRKMLDEGWKHDIDRFTIKVMAKWMNHFDKNFKGEMLCIIDLVELTYWKVAHYETLQLMMKLFGYYESNFPERLYQCFVINAPWAFHYAFPFIKPFVSGKSLQKVRIFDSNKSKYLPLIKAILPEKGLPAKFIEYYSKDMEKYYK